MCSRGPTQSLGVTVAQARGYEWPRQGPLKQFHPPCGTQAQGTRGQGAYRPPSPASTQDWKLLPPSAHMPAMGPPHSQASPSTQLSTHHEDRPRTVTRGLDWAGSRGWWGRDGSLWGRKELPAPSVAQPYLARCWWDSHLTSLCFSLTVCTKVGAVLEPVEPWWVLTIATSVQLLTPLLDTSDQHNYGFKNVLCTLQPGPCPQVSPGHSLKARGTASCEHCSGWHPVQDVGAHPSLHSGTGLPGVPG